jgi:diguanylate cyclase (GGDEF)-like protein/PAS domain S-box-containing protein
MFNGLAGAAAPFALLALLAYQLVARLRRRQRSVDAPYKAIIDQASDGIVIVDSSTYRVQYCNPVFLERLGCSGAEAAALTLQDLFADGAASPESVVRRLREVDSRLALSLQQRCKGGVMLDIELRCNRLDVGGREVLALVTQDVSVRRKAEQQLIDNQQRLDRMAHHDQLTGLPNRHHLASFLPQAIRDARNAGGMLGVVFLDLDRFKHINDTQGHETGDKLLQEVARRLTACVRENDVVIRMGGDEFVVVFRDVASHDEVTQGAARIIATLNAPVLIDDHPLQTSGSVGVSLFPRDGADMGELLKHSDTAMYQAKERGRNNVQIFSQAMNRKLEHRVAMEAALREALRLRQFDVHYQPLIDLQTRRIVGLEALIRWRHPSHGMIPADRFIPVAEETGLIVPMGNFVLHRTLQNMSAWRRAGVPLVPVSLNVAPAQLQREDFQANIATLLKSHGLRPQMLQLEMTERAVFDSSQSRAGGSQKDTMARLRDMGIKIAIDDFGTGYSSLSYLKKWRVDSLKIDRSFVRDLVTDSSDLAIVSAIIAIAEHLHIQVVAEGIEGYQQADILRRLGCTVGQGFLFAQPMAPEECMKMLALEKPEVREEDDVLAVYATR